MKIVGNTVGTTAPRPDLTQENPKKADFVKGKHVISEAAAAAVEEHDASPNAHDDIRRQIASMQPAGEYLTVETDPTVPAWAKAPEKPSYSPEEVGAAPASHTADRSNPHGVTAEQIGARPDTWMPSAVEVGAVPASHLTNMANPHMVTAEQVGARPVTWTPTAAEVGARADSWMPTAEEVGARPATWMPSLAEIGAAPALTEKLTLEYASRHPAPNDLLNIMLNGDYSVDNMQLGYIATEDASTLVNSPISSGAFYAYREVEAYPVGHVLVRLKEMYPCNGRVWSNMYDKNYQSWMGWVANFGGTIPDYTTVYSDDELKTWLDQLLAKMADNSAKQVRFMHSGSTVVNGVQGMGGQGMVFGTLYKYTNSYAILRVSSYTGANFQIDKLSTWGEVKWENPAMGEGVEYCTTEKYMGKPVYARLVNLGAMPKATSKTYESFAVGVDNIVSADFTYKSSSVRFFNNPDITWYIGCYSNPYIVMTTTKDMSAYTGYLLCKYTKT